MIAPARTFRLRPDAVASDARGLSLGGVRFDGCDEATGILLEAKANIDHLFDRFGQVV